ncbi:MAG: peptidoglycan editing factor PgeF [Rhodospirillales bacterium]|nr:peptidoglycan editing factor PgeF [Rhodospirillales bacterium]
MLSADSLSGSPAIRHGFFTREGGISDGPYASLNCGLGSADDPDRVRENRRRAMRGLGAADDALITAYQVHSPYAAVVEAPWPADARPQLDALVTRTPGLALGILTADCAPVLLADPDTKVIGAAHAGWRGAKGGVLAATIEAMLGCGARLSSIRAVVGPCIRQDSYEVGAEFRDAFLADDPGADTFFRPGVPPHEDPQRYRFDLARFVARKLGALGVRTLEILPHDTFADDRFFSYRRVTLAGGNDYGRMLSAITLLP